MVQGKLGRVIRLQFALIDASGYDRVTGEDPANFTVELWIDDGAGGRALADPEDGDLPAWQQVEVVIEELVPARGEYVATFTPLVPRDHYLVVRHDDTASDWCETVQVAAADATDLALLLGGGVTGLPA